MQSFQLMKRSFIDNGENHQEESILREEETNPSPTRSSPDLADLRKRRSRRGTKELTELGGYFTFAGSEKS